MQVSIVYIQYDGDSLVLANPGPSGKWPLKWRDVWELWANGRLCDSWKSMYVFSYI